MSRWIKMECSLQKSGRVLGMSRKLSRSRHEVIGLLHDLWSLADELATDDGVLQGYLKADVDAYLGVSGFCDSMPPEWLTTAPNGDVKFPNYQEHNGTTAKTRAQAQQRKKRERNRSRSCLGEGVTRGEERRGTTSSSPLLPPTASATDFKIVISDEDRSGLVADFGEDCVKFYIRFVSNWMARKKISKTDHREFLEGWILEDQTKAQNFFSEANQRRLAERRERSPRPIGKDPVRVKIDSDAKNAVQPEQAIEILRSSLPANLRRLA